MGTGPMHLTSLMPQKTVTPLEPQPSISPGQSKTNSHSMIGSVSYSILTPINPFRKKKSLNTLQAGLMGLWNSRNLPILNTCQRKDVRRISHGLQQNQQPYQGKGLGLSHAWMLRRHLFCGWNTWKRSWSMLQEQCWLQSRPSLKTN